MIPPLACRVASIEWFAEECPPHGLPSGMQGGLHRVVCRRVSPPMVPPLACRVASIEWFAEECKRLNGDLLQTVSSTHRPVVMKQPIGVAGAITPWNFPFSMITRKVSPAIAVGCPVSCAHTRLGLGFL